MGLVYLPFTAISTSTEHTGPVAAKWGCTSNRLCSKQPGWLPANASWLVVSCLMTFPLVLSPGNQSWARLILCFCIWITGQATVKAWEMIISFASVLSAEAHWLRLLLRLRRSVHIYGTLMQKTAFTHCVKIPWTELCLKQHQSCHIHHNLPY